ncbi:hypothetical protein ACFWGD_07120 [Corynebacterium sp. NPDC060344]|uniref:hypothetical protein n=1 Tax=Corynebacterium sp. NPDC060344 TaxID=3347101 RepID=UPI003656B076
MSDEKLTVAELMARRNKERGDSAGSGDRPRRRRRSLEEGGVSVAELTGSIPRVEADGPRRGAHAVVEDDEQVTEQVGGQVDTGVSEVEAQAPEQVKTEAPEAPETVESPEIVETYDEGSAEAEYADELAAAEQFEDEPVDEAPVEAPVDELPAKGAVESEYAEAEFAEPEPFDEEGSAEAEYADELAVASQYEDEPVDESVDQRIDEQVSEPVDEVPAEPREPFSVPSAVPVDPRPVMANDETGEITFTFTKFHDARTASEPVAEVGPMAREVLEGSMAYDDRPTSVIPVIEDDAEDDAVAHADAAVETETAADAVAEDRDVHERDDYRDDYADDRDYDDHAFDGSAIAAAGGGAVAGGSAAAMAAHADDVPTAYREYDERDEDFAAASGATAAVPATKDSAKPKSAKATEAEKAEKAEKASKQKPAKATKKSREDYAEDNSLSIGLLIAQTIVGLLFGGLVFALFMMLWMVLPTAVVAVIAVAFAFGLVIVVNLIRRDRDRVTPILAGIVGLVVSFAPYVLTML